MPKALSPDLRQRVVDAYRNGEGTQVDIARRFGVGQASVRRWWRRWREDQTVAVRPRQGRSPKIDDAGLKVFVELLRERPDATRLELAEALEARLGITVSVATVGRMVRKVGWTRKKSR